MKIKALLCCMLSALTLTGCTQLGTGVEGLLSPPKLSDEQTVIKQALIDSVGKNIKLKYPKTGEYRSAYVIANIDDESTEEAIVFYEKTGISNTETSVRMAVLDKDENGTWSAAFDQVGDGSDIDKILISTVGEKDNPMIFVGYSVLNSTDKMLTGYTFSGGKLAKIAQTPYVSADITDLAEKSGNELLVLKRGTDEANPRAELYTVSNSIFTLLSQTDILLGTDSGYASVAFGQVSSGKNAVFLDVLNSSSTICTQILYCNSDVLKNPIYELQNTANIDTMTKNARPSQYISRDINSDGIVEIPTLSVIPGYETADSADMMFLTDWNQFDVNTLTFVKKNSGYFSISDGYCLMLPSRWSGTVTVKEDTVNDEVVFYKYGGDINDDMTELMRICVVRVGTNDEKIRNGYTVLAQSGQSEYMAKIQTNNTEPLIPTKSELLYNFLLI